ncbi:alpha/beta fold hydrolase [Actinomycetospora sp. TBRC 11914]|uniref:alpha/beta fold hydrolase n=1 Tax=Actinomycetospora sp. TBRC 11914 TaxID=2729387 RepID=UPI00145D69ED|nr:alpha/beta hydrolase [Actinomycetospora sp. TBRC 11914]NMO89342.1 alpha/beta hydrolase [Actinomycetospora sp. TBRC 11914]
MPEFTTTDGTSIFYKDWGIGQPIVFSHGWPLSSDDWDAQMMFFLHHGYRVVAHDRRGHGRSSQPTQGNDMDHYADDLAELVQHLDLREAVHVGHSAGGGEVARYLGRHGEERVAKAVLMSAVTPSVLQTEANPAGTPLAGFEGLQQGLAANRSEFYREVPAGPFYNFNKPDVEASEAVIANWWRQGMMGGAHGQYECVNAFIREDFSDDLERISVPVLVMNGDGDQIVPYESSGPRAVALLKNGVLKTYAGFPHGMPTTHAETINADLLAFIRE